jgi:hypothetical protein
MQRIQHLDEIRRSALAQRLIAQQNQLALQSKLSKKQRLHAKSFCAGLREEAANRLITIYDRPGMDAHMTWISISSDTKRREIDRELDGDARLYALALLNCAASTCVVSAASLELARLRHSAFIGFPPELAPPPQLEQPIG